VGTAPLKDRTIITIVGLIIICWLETLAFLHGIDGKILTLVIGVIAAAMGITLPQPRFLRQDE